MKGSVVDMEYTEFITPELMILVPVLYGLAEVIKMTDLKNKYIPIILMAVSCLITGLYIFSSHSLTTTQEVAQAIWMSITQGILIASASVMTNQVIRQTQKED